MIEPGTTLLPPPVRERGLLLMPKLVPLAAAGHKTETRRLIRVGASPAAHKQQRIVPPDSIALCDGNWVATWPDDYAKKIRCRFGVVGDHLWVRERHRFTSASSAGGRITVTVEYSDGSERTIPVTFEQWEKMGRRVRLNRGRPSIHMHRWASRYLFEIDEIAAERVQAVDELAALAEGCVGRAVDGVLNGVPGSYIVGSALDEFIEIWDRLHPKHPFASNPWVFVVKFRRID